MRIDDSSSTLVELSGISNGQENVMDQIIIGDEIKVFFSSHPPIVGIVNGMPSAIGDCWKLSTYDGFIIYIQQYDYLIKLKNNSEA